MISFTFRPTKSFLEAKGHPITIPAQHLYRLRDDGVVSKADKPGSKTTATINAPDGKKYTGTIQFGEAGGNFYYQILMPEDTNALYAFLKQEETVQVYVSSVHHSAQVYLLDAKMSEKIKKLTAFSGPQAEARILEELEKMTETWKPFV